MKQKVVTPPVENCAKCGAPACCIDWDFNMMYQVMCDNNHTATGKFNTFNRAVCKWNNAQHIYKESTSCPSNNGMQ